MTGLTWIKQLKQKPIPFLQDCYDRNVSRFLSFLEDWKERLQQNFPGMVHWLLADWLIS